MLLILFFKQRISFFYDFIHCGLLILKHFALGIDVLFNHVQSLGIPKNSSKWELLGLVNEMGVLNKAFDVWASTYWKAKGLNYDFNFIK